MLQRFAFVFVFFGLFCGLAWWSSQLNQLTPLGGPTQNFVENRRSLVESLDRIVTYEQYYHSVYGHFTKLLSRIGLALSPQWMDAYDIRVTDASAERLLVTALSEVHGKVIDLVSIDQDFQIHANFELPSPHVDYLKNQAMKHLRAMRAVSSEQIVPEKSVFKGFFQYALHQDSKYHNVFVAIGIRAPVSGVRLEISDESNAPAPILKQAGETLGENPRQLEDEAFLAQKIFWGETGHYAKTWSELFQLAHFRWEDLDVSLDSRANRVISSETRGKKLEIERIDEINRDE